MGTPARPQNSKRVEKVVASVLARVHVTTAPNWPAFQSMLDSGLAALNKSVGGQLGLVVLDSLPVLTEVDEGSTEANTVQTRMERARRLACVSGSLKALAAPPAPSSTTVGTGAKGLTIMVVNNVMDFGTRVLRSGPDDPPARNLWAAPMYNTQNVHSTGERVFRTGSEPVVAQLGPVWSSSIHTRLVIRRRPRHASLFPSFQHPGVQQEDEFAHALSLERELGIAFCAWAPSTAQGSQPFQFVVTAAGVQVAT